MDWLKKNPEKVALMLVALVALAFGIKHLLAVPGYKDSFALQELPESKKGKSIPEMPDDLVKLSAELVSLPVPWDDRKIKIPGSAAEKAVPLLRSVFIVEKDGSLFDLANPNTPPLRPPVPNTWILDHSLEILSPKVLEMDNDSDGFSNLEEWEAKSDPLKRESHPPYTDKLFFLARLQRTMILRFAVNQAPDFQIVLRTNRGSSTGIYREGKSFPDGRSPDSQRFTLMKYTEKKDAAGMDASEVEVRDNENQKTLTLALKKDVTWPVYAIDFEFPLGRTAEEQKIRVLEGKPFHLSLDPESEYTLVSADADSATIRKAGATEVLTIKRRDGAAPAASAAPAGTATPPAASTPAPAPAGAVTSPPGPGGPAAAAPAATVAPPAAAPAGGAAVPAPAGKTP